MQLCIHLCNLLYDQRPHEACEAILRPHSKQIELKWRNLENFGLSASVWPLVTSGSHDMTVGHDKSKQLRDHQSDKSLDRAQLGCCFKKVINYARGLK